MKRTLLAIVASTSAAGAAYTATDGTLGATSTGSVTITATVPQPANPTGTRISGLQDVSLGNYTGAAKTASTEFCAYHSSPQARMTITQPGNTDLTTFMLRDPAVSTNAILIHFLLTPPGSSTPTTFATHRTSPIGLAYVFNRVSQDCSEGGRTALEVMAQANSGDPQPAGNYTGTFQIVLAND